jgi:hypothetical protein
VVPSEKNTKIIPMKEKTSGKERTRRQHPLHIIERIQVTIVTTIIYMVTPNISVGSYIQI